MNEETEKTIEKAQEIPENTAGPAPSGAVMPEAVQTPNSSEAKTADRFGKNRQRRPRQSSHRRDARVKPEFDQKMISIRRVTRVMAGGRRFSFSVVLAAGNRRGMVGVGQGKASDTQLAMEKAFRSAKKNMIAINTTKDMSIPYDVEAKYAASRVKLMPARGKGILAGGSVRAVLELAGLREVGAKLLSRSKNGANNAYATIKALKMFDRVKLLPKHKKGQIEAGPRVE